MQLFGDNFWQLLVTAWQTFLGLPWPLLAGGAVLCCFEIVSQQQQHWKGCIGTLTSDAVDERLRPAGPRKLATAPPQQLSNLHPPVPPRISQLRPKIGLRTCGPPCLLIGFLIVCLAIGSALCTRSATGPFAVPPDNQCNFRRNTGKSRNFVFKWERNELILPLHSAEVIVYISRLIHKSKDFLVPIIT